jgi:hypothetical protein
VSEFYKDKRCDGLKSQCKKCHAGYGIRRAQTHEPTRQKKIKRTAEWRAKRDPKLVIEYRRRYMLKKNYGITPEQFDTMLLQQGGACAICRETIAKPHVDHDHKTGRVRGILCANCNVGLGMFGDDVKSLRSAIAYLST